MLERRDLIEHLERQLADPQPAERWAMYRLVTPVVDHAFASLDQPHRIYFEFNQTSEHGTHQSVDIAVLAADERPILLVEAKRLDRKLSPEQIGKYLDAGQRGVVTNGAVWILCLDDLHRTLHLAEGNQVDEGILNEVVEFMVSGEVQPSSWQAKPGTYISRVRPSAVAKSRKAKRAVHTVQRISHADGLATFADGLERCPPNERAFLEGLIAGMPNGLVPEYLIIEARKTRVSLFDQRIQGRSNRVARAPNLACPYVH